MLQDIKTFFFALKLVIYEIVFLIILSNNASFTKVKLNKSSGHGAPCLSDIARGSYFVPVYHPSVHTQAAYTACQL